MRLSVPKGKNLLIFDFDGTIASLAVDWGALKRTMQSHFPSIDFSSLNRGIGQMCDRCSPSEIACGFNLLHRAEIAKLEQLVTNDPINAFIREHKDSYTFAICSSNTHATIIAVLRHLHLEDVFSIVVGSDDCPILKPHPDALLLILKMIGIPASQAYFFGNASEDLQAGTQAGVETQLI